MELKLPNPTYYFRKPLALLGQIPYHPGNATTATAPTSQMRYEIDQSIKIEDTSKATYVCLANSTVAIASIAAQEKRALKLYFRQLNKPLIFKLFTFAVLCARLLIDSKVEAVTIDQEYTRHERQIKSFILQIYQIESKNEPNLFFAQVGKRSNAHKEGYAAMKQSRADIVVTSQEVLRYYEKVNKR